ncbi:MAG: GNAT family N-acetyltransferase [Alphaproteobacteria bacterium]|nr:GNAT family N-acetyltransferase [Alphaproteobacteria bacterium]
MIPILQTKRLTLRPFRQPDFEPYAALCGDAEVMRYLRGQPQTPEEAWRDMAMFAGHWMLRGYGFWAVEERSSGAFLGRVGLWYPEGWPGLECGWTLGRQAWGKGYASEAGGASLRYGFLTQDCDTILSVIHVENARSIRVAERLGAVRGRAVEIRGNPCVLYEHHRAPFMAASGATE